MFFSIYDRRAAVRYAHQWAYSRNPEFYSYDEMGGDCTNFVSQCLYAGGCAMNFTPEYGWYYLNGGEKAPAWTGVPFLWNFLTRKTPSIGPVGIPCGWRELQPGDLIQLRFQRDAFQHTMLVVSTGRFPRLEDVRVAAHSVDADDRPLNSYQFREMRSLHIQSIL